MPMTEANMRIYLNTNAARIYQSSESALQTYYRKTPRGPGSPVKKSDIVSARFQALDWANLGQSCELAASCYRATYMSPGPYIIFGRLDDTARHLVRDKNLLQDSQNPQKMKFWSIMANDCWMLGGIHRCRPFLLVSGKTDVVAGTEAFPFTVTIRELNSLVRLGYKAASPADEEQFVRSLELSTEAERKVELEVRRAPLLMLPPADSARLQNVTIEEYAAMSTVENLQDTKTRHSQR